MTEEQEQEFWRCLWGAYVARGLGYDDIAFEELDRAATLEGTDWTALRRKPGRPVGSQSRKPDPDRNALALMDLAAKTKGTTEAETLARWVLRAAVFRQTTKSEIGSGDVKRLARKWKRARAAKA